MRNLFRALLCGGALLPTCIGASAQSLTYNSGQSVAPAYDGWEEEADGTKYFILGYMNRNWEQELDVPLGPANNFSPGNPDQGQPTHFLPRRNRFIFRVKVPASFTEKDELVWTLTANGKTEKAYASLRGDYKMDDVLKASENGALGAGSSSPEIRSNKPPKVVVQGPKNLTAKVGEPLSLAALVTDDGIPNPKARFGFGGGGGPNGGGRSGGAAGGESGGVGPAGGAGGGFGALFGAGRGNREMQPPYRITVGKNLGLHLSWFVYRGAGNVRFDPPQIKTWEDTRAGANSPWAPIWTPPAMPADGIISARVTFFDPGTYVIRGTADDGALLGWDEVTVIVTK
jgi:hypothetical protein